MKNKYRDWAKCITEVCRGIESDENLISICALRHIAAELEKEAVEKDRTDEIIKHHLRIPGGSGMKGV